MNNSKQRDISIDILKFFAVFLIMNSHMDSCYPKFSMLATGGAIGDCLFLFASGYTLFLGKMTRFDNWYKRRVNRIYPSVLMCALMIAFVTQSSNLSLLTLGGGEFVLFIMLYYILLYFVQRYCINRIPWVLGAVAAVAVAVYILWFPYKYETSNMGMYGVSTLYRWIPYFGFMLMGAWLGLRNKTAEKSKPKTWLICICFILCLGVFYGVQFAAKMNRDVAPMQIVTLLPLAGIVYYFYKICNVEFLAKIYNTKWGNWIIMAVSGLCLESYLIQCYLFTGKLNWLFPLNLPILMLWVLVVSYVCRCLARLFSQTFKDGEYDWKEIFKIV